MQVWTLVRADGTLAIVENGHDTATNTTYELRRHFLPSK